MSTFDINNTYPSFTSDALQTPHIQLSLANIDWQEIFCKLHPFDTVTRATIALHPDASSFHILSGATWLRKQWRQRRSFYVCGGSLGFNKVQVKQLFPMQYTIGRIHWLHHQRRYVC